MEKIFKATFEKFAKIFEVDEGQVLAYKEYDSDDEKEQLVLMVSTEEGVIVSLKLSFPDEEKRDEQFDKLDADKAVGIMKKFLAQMEEEA